MGDSIPESAYTEGISVDLICREIKPTFAELFLMLKGFENPAFPVVQMRFSKVTDLNFDQVDDYWGIRNESDIGTDVVVWLSPLINDWQAYHDPGPFTGFRLSYNILRNPAKNLEVFAEAVTTLASALSARAIYRTRNLELGSPPNFDLIKSDAQEIINYWRGKDIEPGTGKALRQNY